MEHQTLKIATFGNIAEVLGAQHIECPSTHDTESLNQYLLQQYPKLANSPFSIALNRTLIHNNHTLNPNDEIALLPPFSGG